VAARQAAVCSRGTFSHVMHYPVTLAPACPAPQLKLPSSMSATPSCTQVLQPWLQAAAARLRHPQPLPGQSDLPAPPPLPAAPPGSATRRLCLLLGEGSALSGMSVSCVLAPPISSRPWKRRRSAGSRRLPTCLAAAWHTAQQAGVN
jgi:hypothetical protein